MDRCQRWRHLRRVHHIIEANNAHLIGYANIAFIERPIDAGSLGIVAREDRGRWIGEIEEGVRLLHAIAEQIIAFTLTGLTAGVKYTLKLDWAELTWQASGQHLFNVAINGNQVLTNFDVYATGGYKVAVQKSFAATANSSGQIVIAFTQGGADNPFISGIELYSA